jgi:hypothetical protein
MKKFVVKESTDKTFINEYFHIETMIKQNVILPFCKHPYRCTMFNGVEVQLIHGDNIIVGSLM